MVNHSNEMNSILDDQKLNYKNAVDGLARIVKEEGFAKLHATGLCLVLFRQLESRLGQSTADLGTLEEQFKVLFDNYLPNQLTHRPSMNNIVATKHSRLLFSEDGSPTVYWSLLADSYRKEWEDYFDQEVDDCSDMETDDEDDGL